MHTVPREAVFLPVIFQRTVMVVLVNGHHCHCVLHCDRGNGKEEEEGRAERRRGREKRVVMMEAWKESYGCRHQSGWSNPCSLYQIVCLKA